ncbi:hypothetical protein E5083_20265 [Streptomyces bauhiniae]|uniref:Sensor domain-containing protein n=1 Tax=Streptomyces bauhiniae TaxID=2340725 RepID=A0A4Z1CZM8_9ACTN|nr:hypothetical protein [Streptomyces bauhiniae]TGN74542.1 hypothetical protein E5083_20265 [Streptomyces bauhiniae]
MSRTIGRRHLAAMALMAISVAACGSEQDGDPPTAKATAGRDTEQKSSVLSQQQLEDAVVDAHDLPGVQVDEIGMGTKGVGNGVIHAVRRTNTNPSLCAPVSAAVDGASGYAPVSSVQRSVDSKEGHGAIVTLASYHPADTARVISELRTALKSCEGYTAGPMKATYEDVEAINDPPQGDDGVAFQLKLVMEPGQDALKLPVSVIVIRHGSALAIYKAASDAPGTAARIPSDLVNAQSKVLDAAVHSTP